MASKHRPVRPKSRDMEATVVCVDNSEWTRSGDYSPTRFQAQADAVNLLAGAKTEANAENTVGVLTMAGKTPKVLVTPTADLGRILNSMQELRIEGECNLASSVQIAQLALKHRQNKNQRQRIVLFVGSPIEVDKVGLPSPPDLPLLLRRYSSSLAATALPALSVSKAIRLLQAKLVKIAKKLKKNNVAVDIVSFGSDEVNNEKLDAFLAAVNSGDNSHLVTVPVGTVLADSLFGSPVFMVSLQSQAATNDVSLTSASVNSTSCWLELQPYTDQVEALCCFFGQLISD